MGGPLVAPVSSLLRAVPPPPLPRMFRTGRGSAAGPAPDHLNPDVPEFVPRKIEDSSNEKGEEHIEHLGSVSSINSEKSGTDVWTEVKRRTKAGSRERSAPSGSAPASTGGEEPREELHFQLDEELDLPPPRLNTFTDNCDGW
ncbi:hypothetical protein O0L34_g10547 [Tuta absoluta]|nr:hypothetical protein O0L34_g10547 [Tuta absoluta]